jgi:kinesin family member 18/19
MPTTKKVKDQVFAFDRIFPEDASQTDVYEGTTRSLIDSVMDGYNATVFAYGATGCGKTHTITGTSQQPGIIFLTMQELFEKIADRSDEKVTELSLSYLEIYNETIRDLLVPGGSKQGLILREDSNQAVTVAGLTSHHPKDVQEVMDIIVQGNEYRTVSPTEANATSSRSHAVLQINVAQKERNADVNEPHTMATLSIIDLAGSERASATKNRGVRLTEGANINKSLLALGSCINALCDPRKRNHVPYRNSKLTRLLKFSLGGNCKTVMIVCVSPSSAHFDETQNTLRYANSAKNIKTKVTRNVFNVNRHVKDFLVKIDEQMALINELKAQQKDAEKIFFAKFQKQLGKRDGVAREGVQRLRTAYENSATERQEKIANMKKLKSVERRIGVLSAWIAAFDAICEQRDDETAMPPNLVTMKKTARGILIELENSRHHIHQRLEKSNWERGIDTALQNAITQLNGTDSSMDAGENETLTREAELLKSNFMREAYLETMEHEKGAELGMLQALLTAQFDILSSLAETLGMSEEEAVEHAKSMIGRLLETGYSAASQIVKPDGTLAPAAMEMYPPSKRGTPKRKKPISLNVKPLAPPDLATLAAAQPQAFISPMKASPRRRRVLNARKVVSFTPVKKRSTPSKRAVRWRDDENEEGTLADFEKTPQKPQGTPDDASSPEKEVLAVPAVPLYLETADAAEDSSPSLVMPEAVSLAPPPASRSSRFAAGFLSKSRAGETGSPSAPTLSLNLSSSDTEEPMPLRTIDSSQASNTLSPPRKVLSPKTSRLSTLDENSPPTNSLSGLNGSASIASNVSSDSECSGIDTEKLRSALHSAKRHSRASMLTASTATSHVKRMSSAGPGNGMSIVAAGPAPGSGMGHRPSASYSSGHSLASSLNGISRAHRRGSSERRRSPPMNCTPPDTSITSSSGAVVSKFSIRDGAVSRAFTPNQARRPGAVAAEKLINGSASVRSPSERERGGVDGRARRITIGSGLAGTGATAGAGPAMRQRPSSIVWR